MQIGELAIQCGVSTRSLRYYETQGLLAPQRHGNGYREYTIDDIQTVDKIANLIRSGISTEMIALILPCMPDASDRIEMCDDIRAGLNTVRNQLDAQIDTLERSRRAVTNLLGQPIIELAPPTPALQVG